MKKIDKDNDVKQLANRIRKNILYMSYKAGSSSAHIGGALSIADILAALFAKKISYDSLDPLSKDRDRFILSKGHACLAYYSVLHEIKYLSKDDMDTFEKNESFLLGHPVMNKKYGIEFSTGSLGMGLSLGIGVSISAIKKKKKFQVYVILGDGECNEGSIWESAMFAPNNNLSNLNVIIDRNNFQQTGENKNIMDLRNLSDKWKSFGWDVFEINGHDINALNKYFENTNKVNSPKVLIANTLKGKGISFAENNNQWHHSILSETLYNDGIAELEK